MSGKLLVCRREGTEILESALYLAKLVGSIVGRIMAPGLVKVSSFIIWRIGTGVI